MVHWSRMAHDWFHTKMAKWGVPGYGSVHPGIPWFWGVTSCPFLVPMVARSSLPSKRSYCRRASRNSLGGFFLEHDQQTTRKSWWIYSFWGLTWGILILNDTDIYIYIDMCIYIYYVLNLRRMGLLFNYHVHHLIGIDVARCFHNLCPRRFTPTIPI